jgi:hypothetical protein
MSAQTFTAEPISRVATAMAGSATARGRASWSARSGVDACGPLARRQFPQLADSAVTVFRATSGSRNEISKFNT